MKVNGKLINADYLDFRTFRDGTARLALDRNKGTFLIRYEYADLSEDDRRNMMCDPEELTYNADGVGRADFKRACNPWRTPSIPVRVERVPYDAEEQKTFEAKEKRRASLLKMQEEAATADQAARERAELDRRAKLAMIELNENQRGEPGHAEILSAVHTEGATTRLKFGETWRGLLEKVGIVRKRARFPAVSTKARTRAPEMWRHWPETALDAQRGTGKIDCYEHHKLELNKLRIESFEQFKAVLDSARK